MADTTVQSTKEKFKGTEVSNDLVKNVVEGSPVAFEAANQVRAGLESVVPKEALGAARESASSQSSGKHQSQTESIHKAALSVPEIKEELVAQIDHKLHQQLRVLAISERKVRGGIWSSFDPEKLNYILSQIRKIQLLLAELIYMTVDALKTLYVSLFQPKGI